MSVYEKALLDPASAFTSPEQVLTSAELSREQKIEILHRWEYDARQMQVAEEENMLSDSDQPDILDKILPDLAERRRETGGRTATVYEIKSGGDVPMSYLDRLEDQFPENCPTDVLTKPTEGGFVSSVSIRVGQNKPVEALRVSVGIPHKPGILAALAHSNDVALWWRVVILEPGGRTLELDTPSGLDPRRLASLRRALPRPWVRCDRRSRRSRDPRRVRADLR